MKDIIENQHLTSILYWAGAASLALLIVSLLVIPPLLCRIPPDYFNQKPAHDTRGPSRWFWWALRNTLAVLLLLAGIAMLVLPGQGLLTMLAGLLVADFPGKFRLERRVANNRSVFAAINWIRTKRGVNPLHPPTSQSAGYR